MFNAALIYMHQEFLPIYWAVVSWNPRLACRADTRTCVALVDYFYLMSLKTEASGKTYKCLMLAACVQRVGVLLGFPSYFVTFIFERVCISSFGWICSSPLTPLHLYIVILSILNPWIIIKCRLTYFSVSIEFMTGLRVYEYIDNNLAPFSWTGLVGKGYKIIITTVRVH